MTELELLCACLEQEDKLDQETVDAFSSWRDLFVEKRLKTLSVKRREWLDGVCSRLGIDSGSANLVSSGLVKPSPKERASLASFHASLGEKPLRPPGRR